MLEESLLTVEQIEQFSELLKQTKKKFPEFTQALQVADPSKLQEFIGEDLSWCHYYEKSFLEHVISGTMILGWQDGVIKCFKSENFTQSLLDFLNAMSDQDEWPGDLSQQLDKRDLLAVVFSLMKTMQSLMVYQKSLSSLIDEVRQTDKGNALFNAVRIDRTVLGCRPVMNRIAEAELKNDNKFFLRLKAALKGPSNKHMAALDEMRYLMQFLVGIGVSNLTGGDLEQLFVDRLKLYPRAYEAQKNLSKHYSLAKKRKHFK